MARRRLQLSTTFTHFIDESLIVSYLHDVEVGRIFELDK